ncbi:hypothetical protein FOL47_009947 [Perkinsus chesapeaki]|uniref:Peptidase A1 domain-containing protein n=1 Tax=Perkinsus chesapeaki TaxID=330153 RepID=A0A7J6MRA0_PERCH|nr:hypothetical protein FOL47_009947 [Perkinsus chesapeaki]
MSGINVHSRVVLDSGNTDLKGPSTAIQALVDELIRVAHPGAVEGGEDVYRFLCEDQRYLPGLKITLDIDSANGGTGSFYVHPQDLVIPSKDTAPTGQPICFLSFSGTSNGASWIFGSSILRGRELRFDVRARTVGISLLRESKSSLHKQHSGPIKTDIDNHLVRGPSGRVIRQTSGTNRRVRVRS